MQFLKFHISYFNALFNSYEFDLLDFANERKDNIAKQGQFSEYSWSCKDDVAKKLC